MWTSSPARARRQRLGAATLALALALAACADETDARDAIPAPEEPSFTTGRFDDLPRFPRSDPLGPRSEGGPVVTRSFRARGTTPRDVIAFYRRELGQDWTLVDGVQRLGRGTYRAEWLAEDHRLRVSATEEPVIDAEDDDDEVVVQYSVTLRRLGGG